RNLFRRLFIPLTLFLFRDQGRALVFVVVSHLAVQAVMTLIGVDGSIGMDRLNLAFLGTQLTGAATFLAPFEPVEQPELRRDGQGGTQRADVTAIDLAGKNVDYQQDHG